MDARTGADRRLLAAEMENPLTLDHVDDLVVDVAVHAGPTRRDDADELRHVAAAEILVHEEAELAIRARRQGRTIRIPHGDAVTAGTGGFGSAPWGITSDGKTITVESDRDLVPGSNAAFNSEIYLVTLRP